LPERVLIPRASQGVTIINMLRSSREVERFSKNTGTLNLMTMSAVGAELFDTGGQTNRQTDMTKLIVAFHDFANAPTNCPGSNI
jgi:hypothetical protein